MARNRRSAKAAGSRFERAQADYWAEMLEDDRIDRRVTNGKNDRGDIGGIRIHGQRLVIECKDCHTPSMGVWLREAETERGNDDALAGVVVSKRHGHGHPGDQLVSMTVDSLIALVRADRVVR